MIARLLAIVVAVGGASSGRLQSRAAEARPNFLFILVDDQSPFDFQFYNSNSPLHTPNIDGLAARGMILDRAYHMGSFVGAVCTPSRHMIMTGRTLWHLPISPAGPGIARRCPTDIETNTIGAVFRRAGYATMRTCKTGNSYPAANRQFEILREAEKRGDTDDTGSAWHAQQVLEYLGERARRSDRRPFLIEFGFSHPHDPRNAPADLLVHYGASNHTNRSAPPPANLRQPGLPPNYLPAHPFPDGHPALRDEVAVSGVWNRRDETTIRNEIGREFACVENIDRQIGKVLEHLRATGELDRTYVIYTSDHGIAIGRHGLQGKQNLYEHTWRVPFVVQGPGIRAGSRADGNIYLLDILATLCDLAGIPAPESNEGRSFRPVLEGKQSAVRDVLYGAYSGGTTPGIRSVRRGEWKLIAYDALNGAVREEQLFNLAENPHEFLLNHHVESVIAATGVTPKRHQVNLAADPRYAAQRRELEALLLSEMRRLHDPYRLWNQPGDGLTATHSAAPRLKSSRTPSQKARLREQIPADR